MLNPNIEMLENLISAAVSTRYKEVPPTEEEFLTLAQSMRATLSTLPVTDEEFAEILVRLRASIVIQMDVGVYINDRNTPHKSWLPSRRADLDFFFWNRYKKYLEEIKHWNPRVTATLDKVSDEIVDLLQETACSTRSRIRVAGNDYPAEVVRSKLLKLNSEHIRFVMDCLKQNTTRIRNIRQYLLTALFNAPSTMSSYYAALVAHDMAA